MPELECFQAMLNRLYRQELEDLVLGYEAYRAGLQREIEERESKIIDNGNIETGAYRSGLQRVIDGRESMTKSGSMKLISLQVCDDI